MTKKEKDWIIKIQLLQLQTENPYLDDFYYTVSTGNKLLIIRKCYRADGWAFFADVMKVLLLLKYVVKFIMFES